MGGSGIPSDGWEFGSNEARTLVLIGRGGDGKSSTGNSILGRKAFRSMPQSSGVTSTCEVQSTQLSNGQILDVIDTPGLFDFSAGPEIVSNEIGRCIDLAKDGIHAVLLVLSVRSRFAREQHAAVQSFQELSGGNIRDYMIVVFTGGDYLEDHDVTFDDYLGSGLSEPLEETLAMCQNRLVLFDNRTKDPTKKADQLKELLEQVNLVVENNGGIPYTNNLFKELKEGATKFRDPKSKSGSSAGHSEKEMKVLIKDEMQRSHAEQIRQKTEMVEWKLKVTLQKLVKLEKQLGKERAARLATELKVKKALKKSRVETRKLKHLVEISMLFDSSILFVLCSCIIYLLFKY